MKKLVVCFLAAAIGSSAHAEDPSPAKPKVSPLQKVIDESANWFDLKAGENLDQPLQMVRALKWDNNARGSASGLTVLFVAGGRPEAVACIYPWDGNLVQEFRSLSRTAGGLVAQRKGDTAPFWKPTEQGIAMKAIPKADAPAKTKFARLRQLKQLRKRFEATLMGWKNDDSDRQDLRPLPRHLYRYTKPTGDVLDGAVFAFVMGTDPEVLLLIEAVKTKSGDQWQYGFVRRTSGELAGRLDGETVWTADRFPQNSNPEKADFNYRTRLSDVIGDETSQPGTPAAQN